MTPPRSWFQRRSRWVRQPKELDPLEVPGVMSSTELEHMLGRERARVERSGQKFCLVVFRVEPQRNSDLRRTAELLTQRVRAYDSVGLVEDERLAALLPETDGSGAWIFADGALAKLAEMDMRVSCDVYAYPGAEAAQSESNYGFVPRPDDHGGPQGPAPAPTAGGATPKPEPGGDSNPDGTGAVSASLASSSRDVDERRTGTDGAVVSRASHHTYLPVNHVQGSRPAPLRALGETHPARRARLPELLTTPEGRSVRDLAPLFVQPLPLWRRAVDILVSSAAILALSPLLLLTAALVKFTSPGPVIFWQWRVGRGGRRFRFYKFRSMYQDAEERKNALRIVNEKDGPIFKIKDDPRITPLGRIIRRLSIDELPQLFNVLKGDMTLVGPRPPVVDEVAQYEPWQRQRLDITGGLTCIWQVSGRSEVSFDDWMRMDIRYKQKRTLRMDVKLLWKTIGAVFSGKGAY